MKTSELIGSTLNWAVAKCENRVITSLLGGAIWVKGRHENGYELDGWDLTFDPATDWMFGGPIIEREHITLKSPTNQLTMNWEASIGRHDFLQWDHAPLIAAMRCYVASKLGDEVDIPNELKG